ncbi:MAG: hypothetical protein ACU84J_10110 [Gammaproteobacteria bacterium]
MSYRNVKKRAPAYKSGLRILVLAAINAGLFFAWALYPLWEYDMAQAVQAGEHAALLAFATSTVMAVMQVLLPLLFAGKKRTQRAPKQEADTRAAGEKPPAQKTLVRALLSATTIASLFFSWALFVNWGHGSEQALKAAVGQGCVSFGVSMSMAFMLEYFFFMLRRNGYLRIPLTVSATMTIVIVTTATVHILIGTPEILKTMTLPMIMGVVYTSLYSFRLSRLEVYTALNAVGTS